MCIPVYSGVYRPTYRIRCKPHPRTPEYTTRVLKQIKVQSNHPMYYITGVSCISHPCSGMLRIQWCTAVCDTPNISPGWYREVSKHAVSPGVRVYHSTTACCAEQQCVWRWKGCKGLANAWSTAVGKSLLGRQQLQLRVLEARSRVFCGKPQLCLLLLQRPLLHSSLTSQRKRLPPRFPQQSP